MTERADETVRVFLTRETFGRQMIDVIEGVNQFIDKGSCVEIRPKAERRRDIQNRLLFRWLRQIAKQRETTASHEFGRAKLDKLHPMKLGDEREHDRAMLERAMIEGAVVSVVRQGLDGDASVYEMRIYVAAEMIRSRDISVRLFAEWLTLIQHEAAEEGIVLTSRKDEREAALYKQVAATGRAA